MKNITKSNLVALSAATLSLGFATVNAIAEDYHSETQSVKSEVVDNGAVAREKKTTEHSSFTQKEGLMEKSTKSSYQKTTTINVTPGTEKREVVIGTLKDVDLSKIESVAVLQEGQPVEGMMVELGPVTETGRVVYLKADPTVSAQGPVQLVATSSTGDIELPNKVSIQKSTTTTTTHVE